MRILWLPLLTSLLLTQALACGNNDNNKPTPPVINNNKPDADETPDQNDDADQDQSVQDENSLSVGDQIITLADRINVEELQSIDAGWLAVYEDDAGTPGALLGTLKVDVGQGTDVSVQLDRELLDAEVVHVALHKDDPVNDMFDYTANGSNDPIALDAQGEALIKAITVELAALPEPALEVDSQMLMQANVVVIKSLVAPIDAWVAIYDSPAGERANIIGTLKVSAGDAMDVQVTLDRDAVDGETLYAVLHGDDPVDGNFTYTVDPTEDVPLVDENNAEIERAFVVDLPAAAPVLELGPFVLSPTEVSLSRVVSPSEAWVVIQDEINGQPGSILGTAFVAPGENTNVYVFLQARALIEGETLYVTLHEDSPQDGNFSYIPGMADDLPVEVSGQPVRQSVSVMLPAMLGPDLRVNPAVSISPNNELFIPRADLDSAGWIAVYENNQGSIGARIGLQAIPSGSNRNIAVTLTQPPVDGEFYVVRMHRENPVDGVFTYDTNAAQDPIAVNDKGLEQRADIQITSIKDELFVSSQDLSDLSTVVTIDTVTALSDSWVVLTNGAEYLGSTFVPGGSTLGDVQLVSNRPLLDLELLQATLHVDAPADGVYDPNADPVIQTQGLDIVADFVPFVDTQAPAVRMTMNVINGQWRVLTIEPPEYISSLPGGLSTDAPAMSLKEGYRYAFVNNSLPAHPLEFVNKGATPAADDVQLSQAEMITAPSEGPTGWTENQKTVTWTIPANANLILSGYRSSTDTAARGNVTFR